MVPPRFELEFLKTYFNVLTLTLWDLAIRAGFEPACQMCDSAATWTHAAHFDSDCCLCNILFSANASFRHLWDSNPYVKTMSQGLSYKTETYRPLHYQFCQHDFWIPFYVWTKDNLPSGTRTRISKVHTNIGTIPQCPKPIRR